MFDVMGKFGNPSSIHKDGVLAKEIIQEARENVANLINAEPEEIYFTSGATEANVWALAGEKFPLVSCIEHSSVLKRPGRNPKLLPINSDGVVVVPENYTSDQSLSDLSSVCSVMTVNNETGVVQNVKSICDWAHSHNMLFHTDATQAVGHIHVDVKEIGCDMLSMSAHKFCGPKGVGALYVRKGLEKAPLLYGGEQESGMRSGTENVIGIAGMGAAAKFFKEWGKEAAEYTAFLQKRILDKVLCLDGVKLAGADAARSTSIMDLLFEGIEGPALVVSLDQRNVSASSGSACSEGSYGPSHALKAMGLEKYGSLRISIGWSTTIEEADYIAKAIIESVKELRG